MALNKSVRSQRERRDLAFHQVIEIVIDAIEERVFIRFGS